VNLWIALMPVSKLLQRTALPAFIVLLLLHPLHLRAQNDRIITLPAPTATTAPRPTRTPEPQIVIGSQAEQPRPQGPADFRIPVLEVPVYVRDGTVFIGETVMSQSAVIVGVLGFFAALLFLWFMLLFWRLLFRGRRRFRPWQPPYASVPPMDPNSVAGRRQGWQQHAQNGVLLAPPIEGNIHIIKLLLGVDGRTLGNWRLTNARLSQYDQYGRIARTEYIVRRGWVSRMNAIMRANHKLDEKALRRRLKPMAKKAVRGFRRNVTRKTVVLPVALDLRFQGRHGEVRIFFELYQHQGGAWQRLDQWEPEMRLVRGKMQENYTYSIQGQNATNGETPKRFKQRLQEDVLWLLLETVRDHRAAPQPSHSPDASENTPTAQPRQNTGIPDTLSDLTPVNSDASAHE